MLCLALDAHYLKKDKDMRRMKKEGEGALRRIYVEEEQMHLEEEQKSLEKSSRRCVIL